MIGVLCATAFGVTQQYDTYLLVFVLVIVFCLTVALRNLWMLLTCLVVFTTIIYTDSYAQRYEIPQLKEGKYSLIGYIDTDPQRDEFNTKLTLRINNSHERIRLTVPQYPRYFYGDVLAVSGKLIYPEPFNTETGRRFNYDQYLRQEGVMYLMNYPEIETYVDQREGSSLRYYLFVFKHHILLRISQLLPEPHASLLAGLLLGVKSSLGPELLRAFTITGVIHIVVLSGFNVTIIAEAISRVFKPLGVRVSTLLSVISIIGFALMTGAAPPVVRASIMALIVILARVVGYQTHAIKGLLFVACVMVIHNPLILLYNPSFQLSFLASLALIVLMPWVESKLTLIPRTMFDLRGLAAASISTQIFVFPLLAHMTGELSLISPLANIVVLWVVPFSMLIGFLMIVASVFSHILSSILILITWTTLTYIVRVVTFFSELPFASIVTPGISIMSVGVIYLLYFTIYKTKETASVS